VLASGEDDSSFDGFFFGPVVVLVVVVVVVVVVVGSSYKNNSFLCQMYTMYMLNIFFDLTKFTMKLFSLTFSQLLPAFPFAKLFI